MKFSAYVSLAFAACAVAVPSTQDAPTITTVSNQINTALTALDGAIQQMTAGNAKTQSTTVTRTSQAVSDALTNGATKITSSKAMGAITDLLGIVSPLMKNLQMANQTIAHLVGKKQIIQDAGLTNTVIGQLETQKKGTSAYVNSIIANLPDSLKSTVSSIGLSDVSGIVGTIFDIPIGVFKGTVSSLPTLPPMPTAMPSGMNMGNMGSMSGMAGMGSMTMRA